MSDQPCLDFSIDQPILKSFEFQLNLSDQKYLDYYRGVVLRPQSRRKKRSHADKSIRRRNQGNHLGGACRFGSHDGQMRALCHHHGDD
jgi:hypothetical protein